MQGIQHSMDQLVQLDRLDITVIVDNETDGLSRPCGCCGGPAAAADAAAQYTSEVSHLVAEVLAGRRDSIDFRDICFAGHGYSLLLDATAGGTCHGLLFDGGPSCELWTRNASKLGIPVADIEAVMLSHWHIDHSVGLEAAAAAISKARSTSSSNVDPSTPAAAATAAAGPRAPVTMDLHPKRPHRRGLQLPAIVPFNCDPELSALGPPGVQLQLHDQPHTLLDSFFYISGHIPRVTPYEAGNPNHASQWVADGAWETDELIADERYAAAAVKGKGVVVFSACSHAGIINVMKDVQQKFGNPPYAVFGGFHLAPGAVESRIEPTVADMAAMQPSLVVGGHCTGYRAKARLVEVLGDRFMPSFVGSRFSIAARPDT